MLETAEPASDCSRRSRRGALTHRSVPSDSTRRATVPKQLVLVVEDDPDIREVTVLLLQHEGYDVVSAPDGSAALELLRKGVEPRGIVLDLMMPVMNGWDFRRHQLADPALASIPVIVVSADPLAQRLASSPGVRDVFSKPVDIDELLRSLERVVAN